MKPQIECSNASIVHEDIPYNSVIRKTPVSWICASDASFADNSLDTKSSQGYFMMLFGGPIACRADKQDTVTTLSTEAELLALSQTQSCSHLCRMLQVSDTDVI